MPPFPLDFAQFEANAGRAEALLRDLGNARRLMILCQLNDREMSVGDLQAAVGISQSALSQHLARLRASGIVTTRRSAQTIWYRIADPAALRLIATLAEIFCAPDAA